MTNKPMYERLNHTRLYEQIVERIEQLIFDGSLKPGDRLPAERELSERFGVSRTVIREAVRALREKGLLDIRPGVGTFVHDGTSGMVRESLSRMLLLDKQHGLENLTQVREIFEPEIAAIAAEKATAADLAAMQKAIDEMDCSMDDIDRFITADHEFHLALARATQNALIVELLGSIVDLLAQQRRLIFQHGDGGPQRGQEHHRRIFQAVVNGKKKLAHKYMAAHLEQVRADSAVKKSNREDTQG